MASALEARAQEHAQQQVARAASARSVHEAFAWIQSHERELSELQLEIARIPAPPFAERARAEFLRRRFAGLDLANVQIDEVGNVLALRPGMEPGARCVALTAHIDTVFPPGTSTANVRRENDRLLGPSISDNAAGVAALLAIAGAMQASGLRTAAPILFIGNVGEEGEGDLRGMRHIFDDATLRQNITAMLILDGAGTDTVVTQALGSRRFQVTVRGPGGHSWSDFGVINPIVVLASAIQRFRATSLPASPKTTFNIGVIQGGTSVNSIPESATMRIDIRSTATEQIDRLEQALREAVAAAIGEANRNSGGTAAQAAAEIKTIGNRPAAELASNSRLLAVVRAVDAHLRNPSRIHRASTDANIPLSLGCDALALGTGGAGGGAHTLQEWYDPKGRDLGLKRILLALIAMAGLP
ncbi:MAG TPA: M20/M25/M40 family metallo-hydrolase [Terriglobales bacterium]|nr:M20/M25/M40 family metallo-hydrolase [Terriglobales bacterium]